MEDLWAFNRESLARAIFTCKKPIVSAIGHETDTTIADFVADARAPTPSAAAVMVTPDKTELLNRLEKFRQNLASATNQTLEKNQLVLQQLQLRIIDPSQELQRKAQRLDEAEARLSWVIKTLKTLNQAKLKALNTELLQHSPARFITYKIEQNKLAQERLHQSMAHSLSEHSSKLDNQTKALHILSPLSTLSRGYSITHNEQGFVVHNTSEINVGDVISTTLHQGKIHSKVYKKTD
jgi:exodeoxyribonuclease VII large subunit